jgi:hypothetical protein
MVLPPLPGLGWFGGLDPRLTPWATIFRASGAPASKSNSTQRAGRHSVRSMKRFLQFLSPDRATNFCFTTFLVCVPSFIFCRTQHFCMEGHLKDSVSFLDRANDALWWLGFVVAIILSFRSDITFRYAFIFSIGVGFLLIAVPYNLWGILILPVTVALGLFALACLLGWIE